MNAPRIAVIDHERDFLALMGEFLSDAGYVPMCWHADEDTFARLQEAQPALAILDVVVRQRDAAWALFERIHSDPTTAHIPVIVCSADVSYVREKAPQLLKYGYAVVEKPFTLDEFLDEVSRMLVRTSQAA